jgi:hypothetical protein
VPPVYKKSAVNKLKTSQETNRKGKRKKKGEGKGG